MQQPDCTVDGLRVHAYDPRVHHPIKLFDVLTVKENGKQTQRWLPLGEISLDLIKNLDQRNQAARVLAEKHVGRTASNVSHAEGGGFVVTFRKV